MHLQITQVHLQQVPQQQHLTKITSDLPIQKPFTGFDSRQKHTPVKGFSMQINESLPWK